MFQESEIINLILAFISISVFALILKKRGLPRVRLLLLGFFLMLCGYLFTVIEGIIWHVFFNLIEHLCYALSGISFLAGCWRISTHSTAEQGKEQ